MAQLDGGRRFSETSKTPKTPISPTFEQLLQGDASARLGRNHDQEEDLSPHRKSVLTKVKEKAKKLRNTLSGKKKHGHELPDDNTTPSWGVSLDDDEDDEDPEYLGAPMYESELAPENYKETARQHPRAYPVVSEKHVLASSVNNEVEHEKEKLPTPNKTITDSVSEKLVPAYNRVTETVSEKLAPAYAAVSDATHTIASKIAGLTVSTPAPTEIADSAGLNVAAPEASDNARDYSASGMEKLARNSETADHNSPRTWDKGVSVKEYVMHKLEPGEDERALSQVISKVISPRKTPGEMGVVEKVREAVSSFLRAEEPSQLTSKATDSSSNILVSTVAKSSSDIPISAAANTISYPRLAAPTGSNSMPHIPISAATNTISSSRLAAPTGSNSLPHIPISAATNTVSSSRLADPTGSNSLPHIPISTRAHEVAEEENHGRILQAN